MGTVAIGMLSLSDRRVLYLLTCCATVGALSFSGLPYADSIDEVIWTREEEFTLLTDEEHKVAFRDVVLESICERILNVILSSSRVGSQFSSIPDQLLIPDPAFSRSQPALYNIQFKATDLKIHGMHASKVKHLHVLRHLGLKDIRFVVQFVTPLVIDGKYS